MCARVLHSTEFAFACASACALFFVLLRIYCCVPTFLYTHTCRWPLGADGLSNFQCARYVHHGPPIGSIHTPAHMHPCADQSILPRTCIHVRRYGHKITCVSVHAYRHTCRFCGGIWRDSRDFDGTVCDGWIRSRFAGGFVWCDGPRRMA